MLVPNDCSCLLETAVWVFVIDRVHLSLDFLISELREGNDFFGQRVDDRLDVKRVGLIKDLLMGVPLGWEPVLSSELLNDCLVPGCWLLGLSEWLEELLEVLVGFFREVVGFLLRPVVQIQIVRLRCPISQGEVSDH